MTDKKKLQTIFDYLLNMSKNADDNARNIWQNYVSDCMNTTEGNSVKKARYNLWKYYITRAELLHEILQSIVDMDIL